MVDGEPEEERVQPLPRPSRAPSANKINFSLPIAKTPGERDGRKVNLRWGKKENFDRIARAKSLLAKILHVDPTSDGLGMQYSLKSLESSSTNLPKIYIVIVSQYPI